MLSGCGSKVRGIDFLCASIFDCEYVQDSCECWNSLSNSDVDFLKNKLTVPNPSLKTKPNALNFAMQYVTGEYVVVYDSEDVHDPMQLIIAYNTFCTLSIRHIGVQAKLTFYNKSQNILTILMSIEYTILLRYILVGPSRLSLSFPLGGTSNHFRTLIRTDISDVGMLLGRHRRCRARNF